MIYLFYGEDNYTKEREVNKIKKDFGEMVDGINYLKISDTTINELIPSIETPAFGYPKKLIIAKNTGLFKKDLKKKSKNDNNDLKEKINLYIKQNIDQINETVVVVFVEQSVEKCELLSTIDKLGVVCNFEYQKPYQIQNRLKAIINAYKVNVDSNTLTYLIECCGTDMQELINETRKLIEYTGEGNTITKEAIDKIAIKKAKTIITD